VDGRFTASLAGFTSAVYTGRLASLEAQLKPLAGKQAARLRSQQGILHAVFGRLAEAGRAFEAAMKDDPTLVSPYVNLANVRLIEKGADAALVVVTDGLARSPGSMLLNLAAARCWAQKGDRARAAEYLAKVKKAAPDVAERYALIIGIGPAADDAQRAADESGRPAALLWGGGE
jgi:tetratricopeptide (TPR) repeat protein